MDMKSLQEMWAADVRIDEDNLEKENNKTYALHAKYYPLFVEAGAELEKMKKDMAKLNRKKWEFYTEGPTTETKELGWKPPPRGKIIKSDVGRYMEADDDLVDLSIRIGYQVQKVEFLGSILEQIRYRNRSIDTILAVQKFKLGF